MVLITVEKFPEEQILRFRSVELDIPHPFPSLCFLLFFRLLPLDPAATPTPPPPSPPPPPPPPASPIFSDSFPLVRSLLLKIRSSSRLFSLFLRLDENTKDETRSESRKVLFPSGGDKNASRSCQNYVTTNFECCLTPTRNVPRSREDSPTIHLHLLLSLRLLLLLVLLLLPLPFLLHHRFLFQLASRHHHYHLHYTTNVDVTIAAVSSSIVS